jgi:hypothetical protein
LKITNWWFEIFISREVNLSLGLHNVERPSSLKQTVRMQISEPYFCKNKSNLHLSKGRSKFERYAVESQAIQVNKANADL